MDFTWHLRRKNGPIALIRRLILHRLGLPTLQPQLASVEILIKIQLTEVHATLVLYSCSRLITFIIFIQVQMFQLRIKRCKRTIDLNVSSHVVIFEHIFNRPHVLSIPAWFVVCLILIFRYLLQVFVGDDVHILFTHFDEIIVVSMYRRVALQFAHSESWFLHFRGLLTIMESLRFWSVICKMDVVYRFWVSAGWAFVFVFEIFVI